MRNARRYLACAFVVLVVVVMSILSVNPTYSVENFQDSTEANVQPQKPQFNVDAIDVGYSRDEFYFAPAGASQTPVLQILTDSGRDIGSVISELSYGQHELPVQLPSAELIGADDPAPIPVVWGGGGGTGSMLIADYGQMDGGIGSSGLGLIGINPGSFGFGSDGSSAGAVIYTSEQQILTIEPLVMTNGLPEVSAVPAPSAVLLAMLGFGFLSALHKRSI